MPDSICGATLRIHSRFYKTEGIEIVLICNRIPHEKGRHVSEYGSGGSQAWFDDTEAPEQTQPQWEKSLETLLGIPPTEDR